MKMSRLPKSLYLHAAILAGCLVFAMAYLNTTTFPFPWNDEARFYLPALWWAEHVSLSPSNLNAPSGIFWVPDGFTLFLGVALRLFGKTMQVARIACEVSVSLGVTVFALGFRRLAGSWIAGVLATFLLLTPPIIFAANMVRMEAPLVLLLSLVLLFHVHEYFLAAGSLLAASLLFHPVLAPAIAGYIVVACITPCIRDTKSNVERGAEWVVFAVVLLCLSAEALRIVHHLDIFKAHMTYQMHRKVNSPLRNKLLKPQGVILALSCLAITTGLWKQRIQVGTLAFGNRLPMAASAIGLIIGAVVGGEMAYDVYSLSIGPALVFCLFYRSFQERPSGLSCEAPLGT